MEIEVGKKYVSRDGKIVTIVKYDNEHRYGEHYYPYKGDNGYSYTEHGCFYISIRYNANINDLVEEYSEDDINDNAMKLEFGKKYVNRNGKIVTIVEYDPENKCDEYHYPYKGDNGFTYTENGRFYVGDDYNSREDLVMEYEDHERISEKNETISKEYITGRVDILIECLMDDCGLITNTGGNEFAVNAIKHCVCKIKEVFSEIM